MSIKFIRLKAMPIFDQLRLEEVLLRLGTANYCIFNSYTPISNHRPIVVTGYGAKIPELVDIEKTIRDSVPIIRRHTGGGTVVVDSDTVFVSLIMNKSAVAIPPYPRDIMKWTEDSIYKPIFKSVSSSDLQFSLREHDYVIDNHKIAGNAQAIVKERWLHHTSFLWNYKNESMEYLLMPKKRPEYRNNRQHGSFLRRISEFDIEIDEFCKQLKSQCAANFELTEMSMNEVQVEQQNLLSQSLSPSNEWTYRTIYETV